MTNPDIQEDVNSVPIEDTTLPDDPDEQEFTPNRFNISSYGWDSDVEGLVKRIIRGDIHVPGFQRGFVWNQSEKSRFIESLIIGLPVPNVFLAQDASTKNLNIVDGQQRLLTLKAYLEGEFYLSGKDIQEDLRGRYFSKEKSKSSNSKYLVDADARTLADAVIHSIVIKPDPSNDDVKLGHEYNQAVIQIFRRLNTSGRPLQAQEIRASIFYGTLDTLLRELNKDENWRALFGPTHSRLRDLEIILRFIALSINQAEYKSPMPRFLDNFMEDNRNVSVELAASISSEFKQLTKAVVDSLGKNGLKGGTTFLVARFDAVMIGYLHYLRKHGKLDADVLKGRYEDLEADEKYQHSIEEFVNDKDRVTERLERAIAILSV